MACVTAPPVQEMSDARQAIRAAEQAGAAIYSPNKLAEASDLLEKAQRKLEAGAYFEARQNALDARKKAMQARERSGVIQISPNE